MSDLLRGALSVVLIALGVAAIVVTIGSHPWLLALPGGFFVACAGLALLPPRR